jgi:putative molybdopterin biosynthesis protein
MTVQDDVYLSTEEAAAYLRLKERKLYMLAADGAVPCSKVTGKWLFPRAALDRWIASGLAHPEGFVAVDPPPIVGGSHDPLLEWALRRSGAGLALMPEGSEAGLDRLARNEVAAAGIHLHGLDPEEDANLSAVRARRGLHDVVMVAFARREQGLVLAKGNPLGLDGVAGAIRAGARFALRQKGAGAQLLLDALVARAGGEVGRLAAAPGTHPTGSDLALAIRSGAADCGIATRAAAGLYDLDFVPLVRERFDLVVRRRTWFEPPFQAFLAAWRDTAFADQAARLGGYDLVGTGAVRFNA